MNYLDLLNFEAGENGIVNKGFPLKYNEINAIMELVKPYIEEYNQLLCKYNSISTELNKIYFERLFYDNEDYRSDDREALINQLDREHFKFIADKNVIDRVEELQEAINFYQNELKIILSRKNKYDRSREND